MKSLAIKEIRKILGDEGLLKDEEDFQRALSIIGAKYRMATEHQRRRINMAKNQEEKLRIALECISFLTSDKLLVKMNLKKVIINEVQKVS